MKKTFCLLGIIAVTAILALGMAACGGGGGGGPGPGPGPDPDEPITAKPGISIARSESDDSKFVFDITAAVTNATDYEVAKSCIFQRENSICPRKQHHLSIELAPGLRS